MNRKNIFVPTVILIIFYEVVAYLNVYYFSLKGATIDAEKFHEGGLNWSAVGHFEFVVSTEFYMQLLGLIYRYIYPSQFIAVQLNIIAVIFTVYFLMKIFEYFRCNTSMLPIYLIVLWPSFIPRATTTMREPLMVMFFVALVYFFLIYQKERKIKHLFSILIFASLMFFVHKAFSVLIVFLSIYYLFFSDGFKVTFEKYLIRLPLLLIVVYVFMTFIQSGDTKGLSFFNALFSTDTEYVEKVLQYKTSHQARATYYATINSSSVVGFIISVPPVIANYMLQPFIWRVQNGYDVYALLEVLFRCYLLWGIWRLRHLLNRDHWLLLATYFVTTFLWASGTTNYGTASRHHLTHTWLIVVVYFSLSANANTAISRIRSRNGERVLRAK